MNWNLVLSLCIIACTPVAVFLSVKLGTYAFYAGRARYFADHKEEKQ